MRMSVSGANKWQHAPCATQPEDWRWVPMHETEWLLGACLADVPGQSGLLQVCRGSGGCDTGKWAPMWLGTHPLRRACVNSSLWQHWMDTAGRSSCWAGEGLAGQGSCIGTASPTTIHGTDPGLTGSLWHICMLPSLHIRMLNPTCRSSSVRIFVPPDSARLKDICSQQGSVEGLL